MRILIALALTLQIGAQTRAELTARYGSPRSEIFVVRGRLKLTASYDATGGVCAFRIETSDHSDRTAATLTDERYWVESGQMTDFIHELIPESARRGEPRTRSVDLRVGEHLRVESWDSVEITRIHRSRRLLSAEVPAVADRLVRIVFKRAECGT